MFVSRAQSFTLLLVLGLLWGVGYSLARYAMTHGVAPLGYGFWQTLGPAIMLFCLAKAVGEPVHIDGSRFVFYAVTGLFGIAIPNSMMYFASAHLSAGWLAVVVNITPMVTYVFALLLLIEFFSWIRMLGVVLTMLGIFFVIFFSAWLFIILGWICSMESMCVVVPGMFCINRYLCVSCSTNGLD